MEPWYRVVTPRAEVREGRSFSPDEFAIALEQVGGNGAGGLYRSGAVFCAHLDRAVPPGTSWPVHRQVSRRGRSAGGAAVGDGWVGYLV